MRSILGEEGFGISCDMCRIKFRIPQQQSMTQARKSAPIFLPMTLLAVSKLAQRSNMPRTPMAQAMTVVREFDKRAIEDQEEFLLALVRRLSIIHKNKN